MDTIFARASAPGKSGVAVYRVSGRDAFKGIRNLCEVPQAGTFRYGRILDLDGELIDSGLILTFKHGASFTGEDVVELHTHGSVAVERKLLNVLSKIENFRLAEPGEFTLRALENGKIDLIGVEALADLIDAETESQRRLSLEQQAGHFKLMVMDWRETLLRCLALLEANIAFSDEEIPDGLLDDVAELGNTFLTKAEDALCRSKGAEMMRNGYTVAIIGLPNVGKSTLLNRIAGRDVAITADIPGTTRDLVEVFCDIDGLPVRFLDTAGLRQSDDVVEGFGIERAKSAAESADLRVLLLEGSISELDISARDNDIVVFSKGDLSGASNAVSGLTGFGVDALKAKISTQLTLLTGKDGIYLRERQITGISGAKSDVVLALSSLDQLEVSSYYFQSACKKLSFVLGDVGVEDILGEIFSRFCIGK